MALNGQMDEVVNYRFGDRLSNHTQTPSDWTGQGNRRESWIIPPSAVRIQIPKKNTSNYSEDLNTLEDTLHLNTLIQFPVVFVLLTQPQQSIFKLPSLPISDTLSSISDNVLVRLDE
ncbi:hypothetical protein X801_01195, partial [Opisthorchis viverrini]